MWNEAHASGDIAGSLEPLLMLCERVDERTRLRIGMNQIDAAGDPVPATDGQHASLRALEASIEATMREMGIRTILPNRSLGDDVDDWAAALADVRG